MEFRLTSRLPTPPKKPPQPPSVPVRHGLGPGRSATASPPEDEARPKAVKAEFARRFVGTPELWPEATFLSPHQWSSPPKVGGRSEELKYRHALGYGQVKQYVARMLASFGCEPSARARMGLTTVQTVSKWEQLRQEARRDRV